MLKNKVKKMKKLVVFLSVLVLIVAGGLYFAHKHVTAYCLNQKQLTDSIAIADSIEKASAIIDSIAKNDSTVLIVK